MARTKTKPGPKPVNGLYKDENLVVRLTSIEYRAIKQAGVELGFKNTSEFIRTVLTTYAIAAYQKSQMK